MRPSCVIHLDLPFVRVHHILRDLAVEFRAPFAVFFDAIMQRRMLFCAIPPASSQISWFSFFSLNWDCRMPRLEKPLHWRSKIDWRVPQVRCKVRRRKTNSASRSKNRG